MRCYENDFGRRLQEALGLQGRNIKEINIYVNSTDEVMVKIVEYISDDQAEKLLEVLSSYHLEQDGFKHGDRIWTWHPKTGKIMYITYKPELVDENGNVYFEDWGYIHIDNFQLVKE